MNFARSSVKLFMANVSMAAIQFLGTIYFARKLGAASIGVFFLFEALLGLLAIPADFGLRGAVEKRISESESQDMFLSSVIVLKSVPIIIIVLGVLIFRSYVNIYLGENLALFLAIALILQEFARLFVFVLRGELRVGETAVLKFIRHFTWAVVSIILVTLGFGVSGLIYGLITGYVIILALGWYRCSTSLGWPSKDHAYSLFDYGKYNVFSSIGGYFYSWMDVAIIGLFLTQAHVGAYEAAWRVTVTVLLLSNAIAITVFPQVSKWDSKAARSRIESIIRDAITPSLGLVIPAFFGVLVFSREILELLFGSEFTVARLALIILMGEKVFQAIHKILSKALQGINRPDLAAYATIASVLINAILNIILILKLGIVGAAIATAVSFTLNTVFHGHFLSKFLTIDIPYWEIGWLIISSMGMMLSLLIVQSIAPINNLPQLLSIVIIGAVIYGMLVLFYQPLRKKIIAQVRSVIFDPT